MTTRQLKYPQGGGGGGSGGCLGKFRVSVRKCLFFLYWGEGFWCTFMLYLFFSLRGLRKTQRENATHSPHRDCLTLSACAKKYPESFPMRPHLFCARAGGRLPMPCPTLPVRPIFQCFHLLKSNQPKRALI